DVEVPGNQHLNAIELPRLPSLRGEAEHGVAREDAGHIESHGVLEIVIQKGQHLERFVNAHGALLKPVIVAQRGYATGMHSGHGSSTKVDGNAIGLLVIQCDWKAPPGGWCRWRCVV